MPGEFLVNPICQCPGQMSCPSVAPKKVEVMVYDKQVYLKKYSKHIAQNALQWEWGFTSFANGSCRDRIC